MDFTKILEKSSKSSLKSEDDFILVDAHKNENLIALNDVSNELIKYGLSQTDQGTEGQKGEKGMYGIRGQFGAPGSFGEKGLKGFKGAKGEKGSRGQKGYQGQSGYMGNHGEKGNEGLGGQKGQKGYKGNPGSIGENGGIGDKGQKGVRGFYGVNKIGKPGDVGFPGNKIKGVTGYKGFKGKQSTKKGQKGDRGPAGTNYEYSEIRRSFKKTENSAYYHGRMLSFLFSLNNSNSVSVTTNSILMDQIRNRRFLVFELLENPSNLVSQKYSSHFIEIDFEPFTSFGSCPVITKSPAIYSKLNSEVGNVGLDWFKDSSNEYHLAFYGVFNTTNQTVNLQIKAIYSFTSLHLNKIVAGDFTNLRI